jgi:hypothetical protein
LSDAGWALPVVGAAALAGARFLRRRGEHITR